MSLRVLRIEDHSFIASALDEDSVVVDLGMCRGRFATAITRLCGCRVVGAEPEPNLFAALPSMPRIQAHQLALAGMVGTAVLYENPSGDPTLSESLATHGSGSEVETVTLDAFLARAGFDHVDLLKVDIEGAEVPMLLAAKTDTLRAIEQITVEYHDFIDPSLNEEVRAADRRLTSSGFRRVRFSRDNTDVLYLNRRGLRLGRASLLPALLWWKYRMGLTRMRVRRAALP